MIGCMDIIKQQMKVLVTGAGGVIGHHLTKYLVARGYWVRGVDLKYPEYTAVDADEFELRLRGSTYQQLLAS